MYFLVERLNDNILAYGGGVSGVGVTSGRIRVYLVFYGSQWGQESTDQYGNRTYTVDPFGEAAILQNFYRGLGTGAERWSGTMTQYCDGPTVQIGAQTCPLGTKHVPYPDGQVLAGVWYDSAQSAPVVASAHDLAAEAIKAAEHFGNTTADSNRYVQYVVISPTGTYPDRYNTGSPDAQFCAWHDYSADPSLDGGPVTSPLGGVAFTNLPYAPDAAENCGAHFVNAGANGMLDGATLNAGHEYAETITDQFPAGGWTNQSTVPSLAGEESADECSWIKPGEPGGATNVQFQTGLFALQSIWSNDTNKCEMSHAIQP
jgi:serine protease